MYEIKFIHKDETTESTLYTPGSNTYCLLSAKLKLECGKAGELTLEVPDVNPAKADFVCLTDEILVYRDGEELWRGRAITREEDFYKTGTLTCEGVLAYLYDTYYPPFEFSGSPTDFLAAVLDNHNAQVEERKRIYLGNVTVEDNNDYIARSSIEYNRTLTVLTDKLISDSLGGYFRVRIEDGIKYLDYLTSYDTTATQPVAFGENLLDLAQEIEYSDLATVILPLGAKLEDSDGNQTDEYLTIADVNGGSIYYVDEAAVAEYGWIVVCNIWEDVTEASNLLTKAKNYLAQVTSAVSSFEVNAVDLALISSDYAPINLGDMVLIQSEPHGVNQYVELTSLTIDLLDPSNDTLTFGADTATLTDSQRSSSRSVQAALESLSVRFTNLVATVITTDYLTANYITANDIAALYVKADSLEADVAAFGYLTASGAALTYATISDLDTATATISNLSTEIANINSLLSGNIGAGTVQTIHLSADNTVIDTALIETIYAANGIISDLVAGTIYTDSVQIANNTGQNLWIDGATIQISDGTYVRVQIGEDASGDHNLYLWNANGVLIWDALGLTEAGLTGNGAIIKDAAVADDAAISGYKLDISSVASCLNENGSLVVDAANVIINESTLAAEYVTITTATNEAVSAAEAAQNVAQTAQTTADNAATAAANAQADADAAATAASTAASNAATAQATADDAATAAAAAQATADAAASDLTQAQADLKTAQDNYEALAAQADATDEELAAAQDAITAAQNAVDTAQATADAASTAASAAQSAADAAQADATAAATAASEAATTAATAQNTADSAASAAKSAQDLADALASEAVTSITQYYALGDSAEEPPCDPAEGAERAAAYVGEAVVGESLVEVTETSSTWTTTYQAPADGEYLWTAFYIVYYDGNAEWTEPTCLTDGVAREKTTTLETELKVVQGQISAKVWQTDIDTAVDTLEGEITTIQDQYTTVTETIEGITTEVGDLTTTVNGDGETVGLVSRMLTLETTAEGLTSRVSATETTLSDVTDYVESEIKQLADSISLCVTTDEDTGYLRLGTGDDGTVKFTVDSDNLTIDEDGNVSMTGKVTATSGTVGGWYITSTRIKTSSSIIIGGSEAGMLLINESNKPYIDVQDDSGTQMFRVERSGAVTSSNLTITGGSITLGGVFSVTSDGVLYAKGGAEFDGNLEMYSSIRFHVEATTAVGISAYYADTTDTSSGTSDTRHFIVYRASDGLTSYFGWNGSGYDGNTYASVTTLRGRTVKYMNSSGTTTLSDERLKTDWTSLDNWDGFFDRLEPKAFRYIDGNAGRFHIGMGAQTTEQALLDSGLTTQDFAGLVISPVQADEEGNGYHGYDEEYGLIYTEFVGLLIDQVQKLKARVAALEEGNT